MDVREEAVAHGHRDRVLLALDAVGAADPAAIPIQLDQPQARHQGEDVEGGLADQLILLLARCVVGGGELHRLEVGLQPALLVQVAEVLEDVVGALRDVDQCRILDSQDLAGLALEHQRAAGRGGDHRDVARRAAQLAGQPGGVGAGGGEVPVGLQRQPAAALPGDVHSQPLVLEHGDDHPAEAGFEVVGAAAVEVDDPVLRRTARVAARPLLEGARRHRGDRGLAVDAEGELQRNTHERGAHGPVEERAYRPAEPAHHVGSSQQLVAQGDAALLLELGPGTRVDLGDPDVLGTDPAADPAAGAVVHRPVGREGTMAEALLLRPDGLGPGEVLGDGGVGAGALADGALDASVEGGTHRHPFGLHQHAHPVHLTRRPHAGAPRWPRRRATRWRGSAPRPTSRARGGRRPAPRRQRRG